MKIIYNKYILNLNRIISTSLTNKEILVGLGDKIVATDEYSRWRRSI